MATRRQLRFETLDDVARDAETLLAKGYDRAGQWDLAQVCGHLANWLTYPVAGFPYTPPPIRALLWMMRVTVGRAKFEKYLAEGMPSGKPTIPQSVPAAGGDSVEAVAKLKLAIERFKTHTGDYLPSPLFGAMTRDEAMRLQLGHAAHHLSFLVPK